MLMNAMMQRSFPKEVNRNSEQLLGALKKNGIVAMLPKMSDALLLSIGSILLEL